MNNVGFYNETNKEIKELDEVEKVVHYALEKENVQNAVFNIIFVDDMYITAINHEFRGINGSTDVIAFALEDVNLDLGDYRLLGDIYISIDTAERQAKEYGHSLLREVSFLAVHGLLHLLGYDHKNEEEEKIMFEKQEMILDGYGITK
ncbi:MAG: rRNA maturation RNase YbeY [Mollicutes bacterium]|nr:rRNA maturation RNase YbeY [Mollicutes bacterium]